MADLLHSFNNPDKGAVAHAIVHRATWEYLSSLNDLEEAEAEKLRREIFERFVTEVMPHAFCLY